ncbi:MAG: cytochrome c oxidase accessory protein CcoG [Saprospirales bacterium]|jgi:cytochrome c oxidase accessory protein FixG|nr:cytochrome c oxidase accessory protein CcoG [Saprospirales bacterium]MBK8923061.1 cytochrome c oxidase accessory protein CcoG [Saprospirales bacterium]
MNTEQKNWDNIIEDTEAFRDQIATVDHQGKRVWVYPRKPQGRFYKARTWVSLAFLAFFLIIPFIKVHGEQFLLFNVLERKFVLFGLLFTPQDFHLFVLAMLTFIVFIILFSVVYGRLFCGWVCPQTVFMEMFFRKIEYWIEGDAGAQRLLDKSPWTPEKIRKKALKHGIFFSIAVVVSNYFLAYLIGMDEVIKIISEPMSAHTGGFTGMLVFSGIFYLVFAQLREQVCTTICPYGRLQGVLLVKESIVVAYDYGRGEPRGKLVKTKVPASGEATAANPDEKTQMAVAQQAVSAGDTRAFGDCIDCRLCIAVCPTGIDIRNGTQLECTNCTACIDACDAIMDKVERPRGLIRYDSMTGIETGRRKIFTPRVLGYTGVLLALLILDVLLIANRGIVETIILRSPGQLYQQKDESHLTNLYTYTIINKSTQDLPVELHLVSPKGAIQIVGQAPGIIGKGSKKQGAFFVELPAAQINSRKTPLEIEILSGGKKIDAIKTNFMGPGGR